MKKYGIYIRLWLYYSQTDFSFLTWRKKRKGKQMPFKTNF